MLNAVKDFSMSSENGLFINSCFAHCQSERQDTWFADDSPLLENKVSCRNIYWFVKWLWSVIIDLACEIVIL